MQISQDDASATASSQDDIAALKAEMGHSVQNLLAMVNSMVRMTARHETDVKTAMSKLSDRINALSGAQAIMHRLEEGGSVCLGDVINRVLDPYRADQPIRLDAGGVRLNAHQITPVSLITHELAANALAFGAFADPQGRLDIVASQSGNAVEINWCETCTPQPGPDSCDGLGARLMERVGLQLGGSCMRDLTPTGMHVQLTIKP